MLAFGLELENRVAFSQRRNDSSASFQQLEFFLITLLLQTLDTRSYHRLRIGWHR